ncbi:hypothetical protein ACQ4PT_059113 [Festuca glaucescens]
MAAAAASDRLSNLSDDLLVRILSFAPAREAASTIVLSRRWRRPLFLRTAAINLDYRSYTTARGGISPLLHHYRALQDADHALALHHHAHGRFPRKFTVVTRDLSIEEDILLSACADGVVGLEELRLDCQDGPWPPFTRCAFGDIPLSDCADGFESAEKLCQEGPWPPFSSCDFFLDMWSLPPDKLPFAALRVLDLKGCMLEPYSSSVALPCLQALQLRLCAMDLRTLQDIVRAAPNLADLRLDSLKFWDRSPSDTPAARCPGGSVSAARRQPSSS